MSDKQSEDAFDTTTTLASPMIERQSISEYVW